MAARLRKGDIWRRLLRGEIAERILPVTEEIAVEWGHLNRSIRFP